MIASQGNGKQYLRRMFIVGVALSLLVLFWVEQLTPRPQYGSVFYGLGLAQEKKGNLSQALKFYDRAIDFNPNAFETLDRMGVVYRQLGDYRQAIEYSRRAASLSPSPHEPYDNLGLAYQAAGDMDKALVYFKNAILLQPDNYLYLYHLGAYYIARGDFQKAGVIIEYFESTYDFASVKKLRNLLSESSR